MLTRPKKMNMVPLSYNSYGRHGNLDLFHQIARTSCKYQVRGIHYSAGQRCISTPRDAPLTDLCYVNVETCDGLRFLVAYVDSHPNANYTPEVPTILLLHGSPGTHKDLLPVLDQMSQRYCRAIIMNFPGFSYTKGITPKDEKSFAHDHDAKADLVVQFLKVLQIPRVDMIMAHSVGCHTIPKLVSKNICDSIFYLCSAPHGHTGVLRFAFVWRTMYENPIFTFLSMPFIFILKYILGFSQYTTREMMISTITILSADVKTMLADAASLNIQKVPRMMVYSLKDKLTRPQESKTLMKVLGFTEDHFAIFDGQGNLIRDATSEDGCLGIVFKDNGHYPQLKHASIITDGALTFLKSLRKDFPCI